MSAWYWVLYSVFTAANVALFWWTQHTATFCKRVLTEVPQRLAIAWNNGYQRGMRDELQDVQHGADNPYIDGPAMRAWRQGGAR